MSVCDVHMPVCNVHNYVSVRISFLVQLLVFSCWKFS